MNLVILLIWQIVEKNILQEKYRTSFTKGKSKRLTDVNEIEKWLKRNFNDVYNREGTAMEKGDVITYIINK